MLKYLAVSFWAWLMSFIMPVAHFLVFTIVLVVTDFITGVQAARARKEKLRSRGFARSIQKITLYFIAILLARGMDEVFFNPKGMNFDATWVVAAFIAMTEFKSNLENINQVTNTDIWGNIAGRLPALFRFKKDRDGR